MRTWSRRNFIQLASIGAGTAIPGFALADPCQPTGFSIDGNAVSSPACSAAPNQPQVTSSQLTYLGSFQPPADMPDGSTYAYGGRAMSWNAAGNGGNGSIIMAGHIGQRKIGEFAVPTLANGFSLSQPTQLPVANVIQALTEAAEGTLPQYNGDWPYIYGTYVSSGMLTVGYGWPYQTTGQTVSHYRRPLNFSTTGQVRQSLLVQGSGNYSNPRMYCGYFCSVPPEWQSDLGGPVLAGNVSQSIVSNASDGPAAGSFNPDALASSSPVTVRPLVAYPGWFTNEGLSGGDPAVVGPGPFPEWNWTGTVGGCCIPNGTATILFFGSCGIGGYSYGDGGSAPPNPPDGESWAYDPCYNTKGEHAYPYRKQIWAYKLQDLSQVRAGTLKPEQLQPAYWSINTPFQGSSGIAYTQSNPDPAPDTHEIYGACYDSKTRRVYLSAPGGLYGMPLIHVFTVTNAVATS